MFTLLHGALVCVTSNSLASYSSGSQGFRVPANTPDPGSASKSRSPGRPNQAEKGRHLVLSHYVPCWGEMILVNLILTKQNEILLFSLSSISKLKATNQLFIYNASSVLTLRLGDQVSPRDMSTRKCVISVSLAYGKLLDLDGFLSLSLPPRPRKVGQWWWMDDELRKTT